MALESSDGKFLYYVKNEKERQRLWKVPVGGGEETQVLESVYAFNFLCNTPWDLFHSGAG